MAEKVVHEVKFVETDDGFRIEVKGDKELLKKMGFGPGMMGFGPGFRFGPHHHRRHRHRPHRRFRKFMFGPGHGPWTWWDQWDDEPEEDEAFEKPV
jgi:hypothetical protein